MLDYIGTPGASKELPAWAEWRALAAKVPDNPNAAVYTPNEGLYAINCCTCGEIKGLTGFAAAAVAGSNALVTAAYGCIAMGRCSSRLDFW